MVGVQVNVSERMEEDREKEEATNGTAAHGSSSSSSSASTSSSSSSSSSSGAGGSGAVAVAVSHSIWIEKYRPETLDEVVGNAEVIRRLQIIAREGNVPNLLLAGPPGTGKTTSVICLAKAMLKTKWRNCTLELNASDDRTIDVIRDRVKGFAKEKRDLPPGRQKLVILDEVDSMTEAAQQALRRIMEQYSDTTRFALACNQSTKIIEPLQSRCAIVRFSKLTDEQLVRRMKKVCDAEGVTFTEDGMEALVFTADGDMRSALNNLQSTHSGFGLVNKANVMKVCDIPPPELVSAMVESCLKGRWRQAHEVAVEIMTNGYTPVDIIGTMRGVMRRIDTPEHIALEYLKLIGAAHMIVSGGLATNLQLDKLLAQLCKVALQMTAQRA